MRVGRVGGKKKMTDAKKSVEEEEVLRQEERSEW